MRHFPFKKVFVINLDSRTERWDFISDQLRRAGIPTSLVERVAAVEGAAADLDALQGAGLLSPLGRRRLREPAAHHVWGMDLSPGAVGCAASHALLWGRVAAAAACEPAPREGERGPDTTYLVVEDDSLFPVDFVAQYGARLRHVPRDWQLLYVSGLDTAGQCEALTVGPGVSRVPPFHRTTNAYALRPAGARALLRRCLPLVYQLDTMMTLHCGRTAAHAVPYVQQPVCYTLRPPLVVQATRWGSDIQEGAVAADVAAAEEAARRREAGW